MVPLQLPKKSLKSVVSHLYSFFHKTYAWMLVLFLGYILLQPHKFQVNAFPQEAPTEKLDEVYQELIQNARQEEVNGDIEFEMLITLEGDDDTITYTVAPGDTLSEIAKLFGTTSSAIRDANKLHLGQVIRVGQKLKIAYDKSIIYDVLETISLGDFATKYDVSLDDLLTLNYFETAEDIIEEGQQIFVPLNRLEAEERGLIKKKDFVMLDLPRKIVENDTPLEWTLSGSEQPHDTIPPVEQIIITAEESQQRLETLELAKKEATLAEVRAVDLAEKAEVARLAQIEAEKQTETEAIRLAQIEAEKQAEAARLAQIEAEKKAEILRKAEAEEQARKDEIAAREAEVRAEESRTGCPENKCYHDGKCRTRPENAVCAPTDPDNAWVCAENFVDTGKECISKVTHDEIVAQATGPKQNLDVTNQWYFNPYNDGYGGNGWAGGHCTMYVGRWLWKNTGVHTEWRGNAKYWYDNAAAVGRRVGQTPQKGSIVVMKYGSQGWNGYGHVGIVLEINREARQVFIEDMNYVGRYVVSQHWVDMDSTENPVIGYIYP